MLLLRANEVVTADELIDALWGASPPQTAGKALQVHVSQLRKALASAAPHDAHGILATESPGYVLRVDVDDLDVARFERLLEAGRAARASGDARAALAGLTEALGLWRGAPLADLRYASGLQGEIARLGELRLEALEERIEAELELGSDGAVVAELETLVGDHPLRERFRAQLMLALYRAGRQADALASYRDGRQNMVDELGIEPGRALRELEQAILRQEPGLDAPAARPEAPAAPTTPFVGRRLEGLVLDEVLDRALAGVPVVLVVGGEAGVGKSRLAEELTRRAESRNALAVGGRCWEGGGAPAYWPWTQALRGLARRQPDLVARALGPDAAVVSQIVPELAPVSSVPADRMPADSNGARFELFEAVTEFLRRAAEARPLVIVLDDLHAADTPSLLLLRFVASQLAGAPVLVVALYRTEELAGHDALAGSLADLARQAATVRLDLEGLDRADSAELICSVAGETPPNGLVDLLHGETDGNPLFLSEIVRLVVSEDRTRDDLAGWTLAIPATVREVIGQRIGRLSEACSSLLSVAAVLGREFTHEELALAASLEEQAVVELLAEAGRARVVVERPSGRVRFAHGLIRETVYEELTRSQRALFHQRIGEALESLHAHRPEEHLAELAHHFGHAGDGPRTIAYAQRAGDRAAAMLAYEEATRLYRRALQGLQQLEEPDAAERCALLLAMGDAQGRSGDTPGAQVSYLECAEVAAEAGLADQLAGAALGYGGRFVWTRAGSDPHVVPLLEGALSALPATVSEVRVRVMARLSGALRDEPSRDRRAELSAEAVDMARELADPATLAYALDGRFCALMWPENSVERLAIAEEVISLAEQIADDERALQAHLYRVVSLFELSDVPGVRRELELAARLADELRQPAQRWFLASTRAVLALFTGAFRDAEELIEGAFSLGVPAQSVDAHLSHRLQLVLLLNAQGDVREVEERLRRSVRDYPTRPALACALCWVLASSGQHEEAHRWLVALAGNEALALRRDNEWLFSLSFLAEATALLADAEHAAPLYRLALPFRHLVAVNADEAGTGSVEHSLGILAAATGRWDQAISHLEAARAHNRAMGARPWAAHSAHEHARTLLLRGESGDEQAAAQLLAQASAEYAELGMHTWATRASELAATGGPRLRGVASP